MLRFDEKLLSRESASSPEDKSELNSDSQLSCETECEDDNHSDISLEEEEREEDGEALKDLVLERPGSDKVKGWRRVREIYSRSKQYIFVAATLPVNGKKTAGGVLKRMFPDATWVSGNYLHRHNPR